MGVSFSGKGVNPSNNSEHTEKSCCGNSATRSPMLTTAAAGWYFSYPESKCFGVGKIKRNQAQYYAQRKGVTSSEGYSSDAESKDSVDQDTHPPLWLNTVILR